jgi:large subunit ribosomal protein L22
MMYFLLATLLFFTFSRIIRHVAESWINKSVYGRKEVDIKGRGRHGTRRSPFATLHVRLAEGKTADQLDEIKFLKIVNKQARSAGLVREDQKLRRKVISGWNW